MALENARLFDETKRLLAETDERAAELAIINSVQQGLAGELDMQAMYDLVGDKIREIFDAQVVDIAIYDLETPTRSNYLYGLERGVPTARDRCRRSGSRKRRGRSSRSRSSMQSNELVQQVAELWTKASPIMASRPQSRSAPVRGGERGRGRHLASEHGPRASVQRRRRRLLTTLAASLSVALENARLFDETKRLLTETDERAAELAIINSVQQGLAAELDMQAMYDLVGDKIHEIFDAEAVEISTYDFEMGVSDTPYSSSAGSGS